MKKKISTALAVCLILLSILPFFHHPTFGLETYRTVTKYHLDMGVIHIWSNDNGATWQNNLEYGKTPSKPFTASLTFPHKIQKVVKAYVLDDGDFKWNDPTGVYTFNWVEDYLTNAESYEYNYKRYMSNSISGITPTQTGDYTVDLSYKAKLTGRTYDYNLSDMLNRGKFDDIIALLGGEGSVKPDLYKKLEAGKDGVGAGVLGYMFFIPIVIEYQVIEKFTFDPGEFEAGLDAPEKALVGETFNVTDQSVFGDESEFAETQLRYCVDDGATKTVAGWKGDTLGETIEQSFDKACSVKYTITTWNKYGDSDIASKTVRILAEEEEEDPDVEINPDLVLPEYTYEGHTEIANDQSTFVVDGIDMSASRVYAEGIARSNYKASSGTISISKLTNTRAKCTFSQRGTYDVILDIRADGGARASDTESIEVRKTPTIVDNLSGFQKQNRKQVLNITVATYPGKPLIEFSIDLKDKVTGEQIRLTQENLQENNATIKTRVVTMEQDLEKGFAYITLEFLTKTPAYRPADPNYTQDFYYEINVKDSKGDTDQASKTFAVKPDLPPVPAISIDPAFLRTEGTNKAAIKAEDVTVAIDGDEVERTWYFGHGLAPASFTNVATMDGYQKLSFGTDKIVGFNKVGVGKFTTKLFVKEKWTEPTLEEYVTDADHLTGTTTAPSDVFNVAPVVSMELLSAIHKDVLILANNDAEYNTALANKIALKQSLLANKIDADIVIKKLLGASPDTSITSKMNLTLPGPQWNDTSMGDEVSKTSMVADSEKVYIEQWSWPDRWPTVPVVVKAYRPSTGATAWTYTTTKDEDINFGQDDVGKYLYLVYKDSNQTVLLDKRTGTVAGTLPIALPTKIWITDDSFYTLESGTFYRMDQNTLSKTALDSGASAVTRIGNKFQYITQTTTGVVINTYDPLSGSITRKLLIDTTNGKGSASDYNPLGIGSDGNIVLFKFKGNGTDSFTGIRVYTSAGTLVKEIQSGYSYDLKGIYAPIAEDGTIHHVIIHTFNNSSDRTFFSGINLDNGTGKYDYRVYSAYSTPSIDSYFQSGGTSYFYSSGWYINGGTYMQNSGFAVAFNGSSFSTTTLGIINQCDEAFATSDRFLMSLFGDNSIANGTKIKISAIPKTAEQEISEVRSKYSDANTYVGTASTTADQIQAATLNQPEKVVRINAANDGYLILNSQLLTPAKKYYYEYEISPQAGSTDRISGMGANTGTAASGQTFNPNTLYVTDSYEENFNDSTINSFFTVEDPGTIIKDGFDAYDAAEKGYGIYYDSSKNNDTYMKLSFTVPAGKQAIVTMDYSMYFYNALGYSTQTKSYYSESNVFVDGKRIRDKDSYAVDENNRFKESAAGAIFHEILGSGSHTIECKTSSKSLEYVLIDNLRVDILETTPKTLSSTFYTAPGDSDGWTRASGMFEISPKVISYGSQTSTRYYGGLPYEEIWNTKKGYVNERIYTQTVPAGYIQKGKAHFLSGNYYRYGYNSFTLSGNPKLRFDDDDYSKVNEWRSMNIPTEGTYKHSVAMGHGDDTQAWMDVFDIVQYPYNAVTVTENMAFNSSYTEYYFPKVTSTQRTDLSLFIPKGQYYMKNLRLYYVENGQKIYVHDKALTDVSQLSPWTPTTGVTLENATIAPVEKDDEYIKIYKKGEKVLYNIFYDDYEEDPSKTQYWQYSHINWPPDTVHPDAGKVLTSPIDRFYLSGKYTVTHWQQDNTQRTGTVGDATPYNKESNKASLTFYINGQGKAPWITYIKTDPAAVKENNNYTIKVGVDDEEKDNLMLETEVYLNGKIIKTDVKTGITANAAGVYPEQTISGLPKSAVGVYQVICTVSDYSGTGIKSYKFTVVSEGKITGYVNHTDQWDANRKKYNLKRFENEVNRSIPIDEYKSMSLPRRRGINVFWSGERFMLLAETEGSPSEVTVRIMKPDSSGTLRDTGYSGMLRDSGKKTSQGAALWEGSLWNQSMINLWGRKEPEVLTFIFTAHYGEGSTKTHSASIIVDTERDYWQLHRLW